MSKSEESSDALHEHTLLLTITAVAATLAFLAAILRACGHGFDFTDESFYLIWISNPFEYALSVTQFGFIYHPLYNWLDGDIVAIRRANVLLGFGLALLMSELFLARHLAAAWLSRWQRLVIAAMLASAAGSSLSATGLWLATPSYNSLCLQAMFLATSGLLLATESACFASVSGWILLGVGGALTFLSKPPAAAALGVCAVIYLLAEGRWRVPLLALSVISAIVSLAVCALAIDGSLAAFQARILGGLELARTMDSRYSFAQILKLGPLRAGQREATALLLATVVTLSTAGLLGASRPHLARLGVALALALATLSLLIVFGCLPHVPAPGRFGGLLLFAAPLCALIVTALNGRVAGLRELPRANWGVALCFLLLTYAYGFGTANGIWTFIAQAALFAILGGLRILAALPAPRMMAATLWAIAFVTQALSATQIYSGMRTPYRQSQPLAAQTVALAIGPRDAVVRMSATFAAYIRAARQVLDEARFERGTPMLDLSGQSPGLLFALGARNLGQAWTIGGYPGSAELAEQMFRRASCADLARAWLLVEPTSERALPSTLIESFGGDIAGDFRVVGSVDTAPGASGRRHINQQQFLKPLRSEQAATAECLSHRASSP